MKILLKKLRENAIMPTRGSAYAAGYDLYACLEKDVVIHPGETVKVGTGLSAAIPEGWFGAVFARSGLSLKEGLRPANCVGVCWKSTVSALSSRLWAVAMTVQPKAAAASSRKAYRKVLAASSIPTA